MQQEGNSKVTLGKVYIHC